MQELKEEYNFLTITTPMFHGADNEIVEFRFPALKSCMRFWWRAVNQFDSPEEMHRQENALFGCTDIKSPVQFAPLQGKFELNKKETGKKIQFRFIMKTICQDKSQWEKYKAILALSSYLGGMGQKSRVGYGSFCLNPEEGEFPENEKKMLDLIQKTLQIVSNRRFSVKNNNSLRPIWNGREEGQEYKKYIVLRSVTVYKPLPIDDFLKKAGIAEANGKSRYTFNSKKKEIEEYSPLMILSAYPAKAGDGQVYPILSQFNYLCKRNESGGIVKNYNSYCDAFHGQFRESRFNKYR